MNNRVFGIGLHNTGTTTYASCLIELCYCYTYARRELLEGWFDGTLDQILRFFMNIIQLWIGLIHWHTKNYFIDILTQVDSL
jgi:hypothetical protein